MLEPLRVMGAHTVSRNPPPRDAHLGIHQMVQGCSPVLKREEEHAQTITVTLTGLNSSCDLQQDKFHPQQQLLCVSGLGQKASLPL